MPFIRLFRLPALPGLLMPLMLTALALMTRPAAAAPEWSAPDAVSQGRAFVVQVQDRTPKPDDRQPELSVTWRGKTLPLRITASEGPGWESVVMLAVPLDARDSLPLTMTCDGQSVTRSIEVKPVPWHEDHLTVEPRYVSPPAEVQAQIARDREASARVLAVTRPGRDWSLPFQRPVPGSVSSSFGSRRVFNDQPRAPHRGTDLRGASGTEVRAAADGVVALAEPQYFSGNIIYLDHGQGVISMYAHLSAFDVKQGDRVQKGQVIGRVGATGRVTGPHLHFGLQVQGVAVDAMPLFVSPLKVVGGPTPVVPRQPAQPAAPAARTKAGN